MKSMDVLVDPPKCRYSMESNSASAIRLRVLTALFSICRIWPVKFNLLNLLNLLNLPNHLLNL